MAEGFALTVALDETNWIARARQGDAAAFEAIYQRYERRIYSFVYRMMANPEDASDLTQDTFVKAYLALPRTTPDLNVSAWLHRIASNACLDVLRRRRLVQWLPWDVFDTNPAMEPAAPDDPAASFIRQETEHEVQHILSLLTPKHRTALVLKEYQGLSCDEIADIMGTSRSAIKSLLFRAREEFRQVTEREKQKTPAARS